MHKPAHSSIPLPFVIGRTGEIPPLDAAVSSCIFVHVTEAAQGGGTRMLSP